MIIKRVLSKINLWSLQTKTTTLINLLPNNKTIGSLDSSTLESCFITENQVVILTEIDTNETV